MAFIDPKKNKVTRETDTGGNKRTTSAPITTVKGLTKKEILERQVALKRAAEARRAAAAAKNTAPDSKYIEQYWGSQERYGVTPAAPAASPNLKYTSSGALSPAPGLTFGWTTGTDDLSIQQAAQLTGGRPYAPGFQTKADYDAFQKWKIAKQQQEAVAAKDALNVQRESRVSGITDYNDLASRVEQTAMELRDEQDPARRAEIQDELNWLKDYAAKNFARGSKSAILDMDSKAAAQKRTIDVYKNQLADVNTKYEQAQRGITLDQRAVNATKARFEASAPEIGNDLMRAKYDEAMSQREALLQKQDALATLYDNFNSTAERERTYSSRDAIIAEIDAIDEQISAIDGAWDAYDPNASVYSDFVRQKISEAQSQYNADPYKFSGEEMNSAAQGLKLDQYEAQIRALEGKIGATQDALQSISGTEGKTDRYYLEMNAQNGYTEIPKRADFAQNSKPVPGQDIELEVVTYAPGDMGAIQRNVERIPFSEVSQNYMTPEELAVAYYLRNTQGNDAASKYIQEYLKSTRGQRESEAKATAAQDEAANAGGLEAAGGTLGAAIASRYLGAVGMADVSVDRFRNWLAERGIGEFQPVDTYNPASNAANAANEYTSAISSRIDESAGGVASFLYDTGVSIVGSAAGMLTGPIGAGITGGLSAGNAAYRAALDRGLDEDAAYATAGAATIFESLFEYLSVEKLFSMSSPKSAIDALKNVFKQGAFEASEEVATTLANTAYDNLVNGGMSEINQRIADLQAGGMDYNAARKIANSEWGQQLALDAAGGLISGGVFAAGNQTGQYLGNRNDARTPNSGATNKIIDGMPPTGLEAPVQPANTDTAKPSPGTPNALKEAANARADAYKAGTSGNATITGADGAVETVTPKGIVTVGQNAASVMIAVEKADGTTTQVPVSEVEFASDAEAQLYNYASGMPTPAMAEYYRETVTDGQVLEDVAAGMLNAYEKANEGGWKLETVQNSVLSQGLTDEQIKASFLEGMKDRGARVKAEQAAAEARQAKETDARGVVEWGDVSRKALAPEQRTQVDLASIIVSATSRVKLQVFQSKANADETFTTANGYYNTRTGAIGVDVNAGRNKTSEPLAYTTFISTLSHELTHKAQTETPELYEEYRALVLEYMQDQGLNLDEMIETVMANDKTVKLREDALDEIVANASSTMLRDSDYIDNLLTARGSKVRAIGQKLLAFVRRVKAAIQKAVSGNPNVRREAEVLLRDIDKFSQKWSDMMIQATGVANRPRTETKPAQMPVKAATEAVEAPAPQSSIFDEIAESNAVQPAESTVVVNEDGTVGVHNEPPMPENHHIDNRTWDSVADKAMTPFSNDYKMSRVYMGAAAQAMLYDLDSTSKGERYQVGETREWIGVKRQTTDQIAYLLDNAKMSYMQIRNALNKLAGAYTAGDLTADITNSVGLKRVEFALDRMLTEGYTTLEGVSIAPDLDYIEYKRSLPGAKLGVAVPSGAVAGSFADYVGAEVRNSARERDASYLAAVESGDMDAAQRMVDEAAKAAGYTLRGYHGTSQPTRRYDRAGYGDEKDYKNKRLPFTVFKTGQSGGIYVATNRAVSEGFKRRLDGAPGTVMSVYTRFVNPLIVNEHIYTSVPFDYNIPTPTEMRNAGYKQADVSTEEISAYARKSGYDGVIIEGIREGGGTYTDDYIAFGSNQIKLSDPVVYDDSGSVIPLSERFNPANEDIRYSAREVDVLRVNRDAEQEQKRLNATLSKISHAFGLEFEPATNKSINSTINKVLRKWKDGKLEYGVYSIKDHTRGKLELRDFDQTQDVLDALRAEAGDITVEAIGPTELGYRGIHVTWRNKNGLYSEVQLTRADVWKVKMASDAIYDKWRNLDRQGLPPDEERAYLDDLDRSNSMWNQLDLPDFSKYDNSSSESGRPFMMSPQSSGDLTGIHFPSTSSLVGLRGSSMTRPDSVMDAIESSPPNSSITLGEEGVNTLNSAREVDSEGNELSEGQKEFFKDSKIRDDAGRLLVTYHGRKSTEGIGVFDMRERDGGAGRRQVGAYFSANNEYAASYPSGANNPTVDAYLNITNPYVASDYSEVATVDGAKLAAFEAQGYDGVVFHDDDTGPYATGLGKFSEILAFYPDQIKLTTNTDPTDSPDIRYSARDMTQISDREILATAFETVAQNENERGMLADYRKRLKEYDALQADWDAKRARIKELSFGKYERTPETRAELVKVKNQANVLAKRVSDFDKRLLKFEAAAPLRAVVETQRKTLDAFYKGKITEAKLKERMSSGAEIARVKRTYDERIKAIREQRDAKVEATKQAGRERIENLREGRKDTEIRHKMLKIVDEFNKRLIKPREGFYVPDSLRDAIMALNEVDIKAAKGDEAQDKLARILTAYEAIKDVEGFETAYDAQHAEYINGLVERIASMRRRNGKPISVYDLKGDDLRAVYNVLRGIKHSIVNAVKLVSDTKNREATTLGLQAMQELTTARGKYSSDFLENRVSENLDAYGAFMRYGNMDEESAWAGLYEMISNGELDKSRYEQGGNAIFEPLLKGSENLRNIRTLRSYAEKDLVDVGFKDAAGKAVKMARGQMVMAYLHLDSPDNLLHVMYGGLTLPDLAKYYNHQSEAWGTGARRTAGAGTKLAQLWREVEAAPDAERAAIKAKIDALTQEEYARLESIRADIESRLTEYERKFIAASREFLDGYSKRIMNEASMKRFGYEIATEEKYVPIKSNPKFIKAKFEAYVGEMSLENIGIAKSRIEGASNPILLYDVTDAMRTHISKVAMYAAMINPVHDFAKVFNVGLRGHENTLQAALSDKFGERASTWVKNYIQDAQGLRDSGEYTFFDKTKGNFSGGVLIANIGSALKNYTSYFGAAAEVGWKHTFHALVRGGKNNWTFSGADKALIGKYTPMLNDRMRGMTTKELGDINKMIGWGGRIGGKIDVAKLRGFLNILNKTDAAATGRMWYAAQYYVDEQFPGLAKGTQEQIDAGESPYYKKVAEVYNRSIQRTQQTYTASQLADVLRNPDKIVRSMTMFMSQPLKQFGMIYTTTAELRAKSRAYRANKTDANLAGLKKARVKMANTTTAFVVMNITEILAGAVASALYHSVKRFRDDDDELTWESFFKWFGIEYLNNMIGTVAYGNIIGDLVTPIITGDQYYGVESGAIAPINDLATATYRAVTGAQKLLSEDFESDEARNEAIATYMKGAGLNFGFNLSRIFGVPAQNIYKFGNGLYLHTLDALNGEFLSFEAGTSRAATTNYRRMFNAILADDTAKVEDVLAELVDGGKDEATIAQGMRNNAIKPALLAGTIDAEKAMELVEDYGGKTADEAYWLVKEWQGDETSEDGEFNKYAALREAVVSGSGIDAARNELSDHGVTEEEISKQMRGAIKEAYYADAMTTTAAQSALVKHGLSDNKNAAYWLLKEWDYAEVTGDSTGFSRYDGFLDAVPSGGTSMIKAANELLDHGVDKSDAAGEITKAYKAEYLALKESNPAAAERMLVWLLDAYEALGYERDYEYSRYISKWK